MAAPRTIFHADVDAFFAAVEQRDDPSLRGRPVVVGGASARGVIAAASYEARVYGIHSAMPSAEARKRCPEAVFVRGDMRKYRAESRRIFEIFRRYSPLVEGLSVDEAFLDMTGSTRLLGPPREVAERLRREVRDTTGLTVSVGIAPVKMVAKIASDVAKPDGCTVVAADEIEAFLAPLPVGRIWGVGPVARARLAALGLVTIGDLARRADGDLHAAVGAWGVALARLARGEDAREVEPYREAKSYGEENTFDTDLRPGPRLESAIRQHAEAVARRLRHDGVHGRGVTLKLKLARSLGGGRFPLLTRSQMLAAPTDDGAAIARTALGLLGRAALREPVRLVGVSVSHVEAADADPQLALALAGDERGRRTRLNSAIDAIQSRFGDGALRRGVTPVDRAGLSLQIKRGDEGRSA
jgi:DNA polymerase-4